jgi:uncharacterized protein (TIGR00251 family)
MSSTPVRSVGDAVRVDVLVVPNASRSHIVGLHGDRVKVRISAPPEKGRANKELVGLLMEATGASGARVISGGASRRKTVELIGVRSAGVRERLVGDV